MPTLMLEAWLWGWALSTRREQRDWEVIDMFRLAAERRLPVYTHVRSSGRAEPGSSIESISEVIGAAAITGAPLHIVHINSSCGRDWLECLSMIEGARARGLDGPPRRIPTSRA